MLTKGILSGVKVLGIEQQIAAPYCTMILADHGAEVIKVERVGVGDPAREMAPILKNGDAKNSGYYLRFNRNKKSITLNFNTDEGKGILKELIKNADIIVENFKPGMMDKMGLSYENIKTINPKAVYIAISGFGRMKKYEGPYSKHLAYDIIAQATSGLMDLAGQKDGPPTWLGVSAGDVVTGIYAANAALLGHIKQLKTGKGEYIDIAMYDCMVALAERAQVIYALTGNVITRGPDKLIWPWGPFKAKDGYIALMVPTEDSWKKFCKAIDHLELLDNIELQSGPGRAKNIEYLLPIIATWLSSKTKQEACDIFMAAGLPCAPVQNAKEVHECPHLAKREMFVTVPDKIMGEITVVGAPYKFAESHISYTEAPLLGEHTESILSAVGYGQEEIAVFRSKKII